jgi:hypothetical protein
MPVERKEAIPPQSLAPRRFRLTQAINNGDRIPRVNFFASNPVSFMAAVSIAAPCYAVRPGFANGFNFTQTIAKAAVYPSDTYSGSLTALSARNISVVPTHGAKASLGSPIFFDGTSETSLNLSGANRRLSLPANAANSKNLAAPFTISWSDWAPCTSLPRADGEKWPLLFVYITITSNSFMSTASNYLNLNTTLHRGKRMVGGLRATINNIDFADNPVDTEWGAFGDPPFGPWFVLQYLTTIPSIQIVMTRDSLAAAPQSDGVSNPVWRAAADLSSDKLPIEVLNLAVGAATWKVYAPLLSLNAAAIQPSIVIPQVISRNGMGGAADMQQLLAMAILNAQVCSVPYGSKVIWNIPGCEPSWDNNHAFSHGFWDMRNRLLDASALSGVPVIDAPAVIGDIAGNAPWNYITSPAVSDDNTHPNAVGQEMVVPLAKAALKTVIGLS